MGLKLRLCHKRGRGRGSTSRRGGYYDRKLVVDSGDDRLAKECSQPDIGLVGGAPGFAGVEVEGTEDKGSEGAEGALLRYYGILCSCTGPVTASSWARVHRRRPLSSTLTVGRSGGSQATKETAESDPCATLGRGWVHPVLAARTEVALMHYYVSRVSRADCVCRRHSSYHSGRIARAGGSNVADPQAGAVNQLNGRTGRKCRTGLASRGA